MKVDSETVTLPDGDDEIAPVRILDADGRLVRVVPAAEFLRARSASLDRRPALVLRRERRRPGHES
jgi:hypothetical protein